MAKNATKTIAAPKAKTEKVENKRMHFILDAKAAEGQVYTIVPEGVYGKERWFHNKQYEVTATPQGLRITATVGQLKARGIDPAQATEIAA